LIAIGGSIQFVRRLRAMLEDLIESLPETRAEPMRHELLVMKKTAARSFQEPEDKVLAGVSDSQGVGGMQEPSHPRNILVSGVNRAGKQ
jgi:hypothetical protein